MSSEESQKPVVFKANNVRLGYRRRGLPFLTNRRTVWALDKVSLEVRAGETVGIIGRNGSGKSTLLRLLAGIIDPDEGDLDRAPGRASLLSLQVGFLGHLTGRENAMLSGMLLGLSRSEVVGQLEQIIDFAEMEDFIDEPIATYSSGMRARLGFATAYHCMPDVLLIDEVLGVGDFEFRKKSRLAIQDMIESEKTVVIVSHSAPTIRQLCSKAVWIENGRTAMQGETEEVVKAYQRHMRKPD